jgi:2-polyprenyl-6-methoxyphenol hydroxylase-like FAD-dependent oxidoreductase
MYTYNIRIAAKEREESMASASHENTVLVIGGGIGGMGCALALTQAGFDVELMEQAPEIGEIGAGIQLGPNAFAAMDALGCGPRARARAVYTDDLIMMDAVDESVVGKISAGEAFRARFKNPYAVIHRADIHQSIYEEVQTKKNVHFHTNSHIVSIDIGDKDVRAKDSNGKEYRGIALIGCDGAIFSIISSSLSTAAKKKNGACAKARARKCNLTSPISPTGRVSSSTSRPHGGAGPSPIAIQC